MPRKKTAPSKTQPPKIDSSIFEVHCYFQQTFEFTEDESKIICPTCKEALTLPSKKNTFYKTIAEEKYTFQKRWLPYHLDTVNHKKFEEDKKGLQEVLKLFGKEMENSNKIKEECQDYHEDPKEEKKSEDESIETKVQDKKPPLGKQNEIDLIFEACEFMIKRHLPFDAAEAIFEFAQKITSKYHPDLIQRTIASSTTMSQVIKECIGGCFKDKLFKSLETSPFSILIDGSSDHYGENYLGILVRYIDNLSYHPVTKLLSVIEIGPSSTGEAIFDKVVEELFNTDFDITKNLIAICTDGGSNLVSTQGSGFFNRLQKILPNVVHVKDLCHAYHNIAEETCKLFPKYIIDFVKDSCGIIHRSVQKQIKYNDFLTSKFSKDPKFNPSNLKRVPSFKEIRWLSLSTCASYLVQNWENLKEFYELIGDNIKEDFTPEYALFVNFLSLILTKLQYYTVHFEKGSYLINHVVSQMKMGYSEFIAYILKAPYDKPEKEKDYFNIVFPISLDEEPLPSNYFKSIIELKSYFLEKFPSFSVLIDQASQERQGVELTLLKLAKDVFKTIVGLMKTKLLFTNEIIMKSLVAYFPEELDPQAWIQLAK